MNKLTQCIAVFTLTLCTMTTMMAQEKKVPTSYAELLSGSSRTAQAMTSVNGLQWWGDLYLLVNNNTLTATNPKNGKVNTLTTLDDVNAALTAAGAGQLRALSGQTLWEDKPWLLITTPGNYVVYDWQIKQVVRQNKTVQGAGRADYAKESGHVAYSVGNNLYVDEKQISNEPDGIVVGQSVHRNEFGINKGTFWSPKGDLLAFYKMDESMVTQYPLVNIDTRIAEYTPVRYPMAGMTSHKVWVGIYNVATGRIVYLDAGDPTDRYFTNISWAPDEKSIYLVELNRDQNHAKLCQYDVESGQMMGVLYEETHPKYVEPEDPIVFLPWDDTKFIYQTERDGFKHLYLMDTKVQVYPEKHEAAAGGTYIESLKTTQLTKGNWLVQGIVGFNTKAKEIIYLSTQESPLQSNVYKVNMKGQVSTINNDEAVHSVSLSASGTYLIDRYTTPTQYRLIDIVEIAKPAKKQNLLTIGDNLDNLQMPHIEVGTIKADDGVTDLYYRLIKPANFDASKKYPAVTYVYGGPHAQNISATIRYGARTWELYMASKGYVMFCLDNRGSENRGLIYEQATFRHLGVEETKDQRKGAEFLMSLPYVDKTRLGVHGWSFGGHMTTSMMLRLNDIYQVGVAGGPVIDWQWYEVMYGERYMDTPQTNPEGYAETNLRNLAGNLKGHLLMVHGYQDETCVPQHTLGFIKACVDANVQPDLFLYPGHQHGVSGKDAVHLYEKITQYFEDHLK